MPRLRTHRNHCGCNYNSRARRVKVTSVAIRYAPDTTPPHSSRPDHSAPERRNSHHLPARSRTPWKGRRVRRRRPFPCSSTRGHREATVTDRAKDPRCSIGDRPSVDRDGFSAADTCRPARRARRGRDRGRLRRSREADHARSSPTNSTAPASPLSSRLKRRSHQTGAKRSVMTNRVRRDPWSRSMHTRSSSFGRHSGRINCGGRHGASRGQDPQARFRSRRGPRRTPSGRGIRAR